MTEQHLAFSRHISVKKFKLEKMIFPFPPASKYVRPLLTNNLLYSMIWWLLYRFDGVLLVTLASNIFQNQYFSSLLRIE